MDGARFRARIAATLEFLSVVRHDPALQARVLAAQRLADEALGELVSALCTSLGIDPPRSAQELALEVNALLTGLAIRSLFDVELDVPHAISTGVNRLLSGDRTALREGASHAH